MSDEIKLRLLVTAEHRNSYRLHHNGNEIPGRLSGSFLNRTESRIDFPAVGDYAEATLHDDGAHATIHGLFPRKSLLLRKEVWTGKDAQTVAANIDRVFIVMGLDGNFNISRLERLMVAAWDSGATPAVILTKKDLCTEEELEKKTAMTALAAPGIDTICMSSVSGEGVPLVSKQLESGITCCFIGSSGAGKSTLLNRLLGADAASTSEVRENDSRGRHTTTARQLYFLPNGAKVIDTPGIREFCLEYAETGLDSSFPEIEALAAKCRFGNCSHNAEPGCAVKAAIERGELLPERLKNYQKMQREMFRAEAKTDTKKKILAKRKMRTFAKMCRNITETKRRLRDG